MPSVNEYDLGYRPESYWDRSGFTNVKGEMRRRIIKKALADGEFERLPASLFSDELSDEERSLVSRIHPTFMGGEFLPAYMTTEVEIARVTLQSVTWDVISVRARIREDGLIHYQIVDEYTKDGEERYRFQPKTSGLPLTMGELITMLDTSEPIEKCSISSLGFTSWRDGHYGMVGPGVNQIESLVNFVQVSSGFYPDLARWYEEEALEWKLKKLAELKQGDPPANSDPTSEKTGHQDTKTPEADLTNEPFNLVTELEEIIGPENLPFDPMVCDTVIRTLSEMADKKGLDWMRENKVILQNQLAAAMSIFG